jgi:hypothetical protein
MRKIFAILTLASLFSFRHSDNLIPTEFPSVSELCMKTAWMPPSRGNMRRIITMPGNTLSTDISNGMSVRAVDTSVPNPFGTITVHGAWELPISPASHVDAITTAISVLEPVQEVILISSLEEYMSVMSITMRYVTDGYSTGKPNAT